MHETTRRRWCRTTFVLLCLLPTCAVAALAVAVRTARFRQAHEQALAEWLQVDVEIGAVHWPRPGVYLYDGVTLRDPETHVLLARAWTLEVRQDEHALRATLSLPEVNAAGAAALRAALERALRDPAATVRLPFCITSTQLMLGNPPDAHTLTNVEARVEAAQEGSQATITFGLAGGQAPDPFVLHVARNRQIAPPTTSYDLQTGATPLPCALLATVWPEAARLDGESSLSGSCWIERSGDDWNADFHGTLHVANLDPFVTEQFPHKLSGPAELTLRSARFRRGRLEEAEGTLQAGPGVMDRSLLVAATEVLGCRTTDKPRAIGERSFRYKKLAMSFMLDSRGLALRGTCPGVSRGTILADEHGVLLTHPPGGPQQALNLVRMLNTPGGAQDPLTPLVEQALQWLPRGTDRMATRDDGAPPRAIEIRVKR